MFLLTRSNKNQVGENNMTQPTTHTPDSSIILDEAVYLEKGIDHRRVGIFSETIKDRFDLEPVEAKTGKLKPENIIILKDTGAAIDGGNP